MEATGIVLVPLLFLDGWRIPKDDLPRDATTVLKLALGLVIFTVLGMGFFIRWLIPAIPLAVSFALAAVISPTDPIAVSAIVGRAGIPPRLMHILQGEALLNDVSGLACRRCAVAAALTGTFSLPGGARQLSVGGGRWLGDRCGCHLASGDADVFGMGLLVPPRRPCREPPQRRRRGAVPMPIGWRLVLAISLAGVRGAVTLAGVLTLPLTLGDGMAFPTRDLLLLLTAGVIVLSLLVATLGLPTALRGLDLPAEGKHHRAERRARTAGAEAAILAIEKAQPAMSAEHPHLGRHPDASKRIVDMYRQRIARYTDGDDANPLRDEGGVTERELRLVGLPAERSEILRTSRFHGVGDLAGRAMVRELDLQETRYGG